MDTLRGFSRGQYHIALARPRGIEEFFAGLPQIPKDLQGYTVEVPLEAASGPPAVLAQGLFVYFNGWRASRKEWRIPRQRPNSAYALWRPGVGPTASTTPGTDAIVIVRDEHGRFHARWMTGAQRGALRGSLQQAIAASETGTRVLQDAEFASLSALVGISGTAPRGPAAAPAPPAPPTVIGSAYQVVALPTSAANPPAPFTVDPDVVDRGNRAHIDTQNRLALRVQAAGLSPLKPVPTLPPYDLAWTQRSTMFVAEVKSLTAANEERQLRLGLGQVLRYAHALRTSGVASVQAVLVTERAPQDLTWLGTCAELGVLLTWPSRFFQSLGV